MMKQPKSDERRQNTKKSHIFMSKMRPMQLRYQHYPTGSKGQLKKIDFCGFLFSDLTDIFCVLC
jgi:hypothetical protein